MIAGGGNKDAYDLYYVVRNYGNGIKDVYRHLSPLLKSPEAQTALKILKRDFSKPDQIGPLRVAEFLYKDRNDDLQADVVGFIGELLTKCGVR